MIDFLRDELRRLDQSAPKLRWFGWLFAGILTTMAIWLWAKAPDCHSISLWMGTAAFLLFGLSWQRPTLLTGAHRCWMAFALCLGWVVSRILLTLLFFIVVVPTGLAGRLFGWRFMQMRRVCPTGSLWLDKPPREKNHHSKLH